MTDPYVISDLNPWLPSVDVHADSDDLVLHADMSSWALEVEVRFEGDELVVEESSREPARAMHCGRVHLPFVPPSPPAVSRLGPGILEVRVQIPA